MCCEVPAEYANLPRLDGPTFLDPFYTLGGRAVIEFTLTRGQNASSKVPFGPSLGPKCPFPARYSLDSELYKEAKFKLTVDGYAAPLSALEPHRNSMSTRETATQMKLSRGF